MFLLLILTQADNKAANKLEVEAEIKKRKRSNTPEQRQPRKHRKQQQQSQTEGLITGMTHAVHELCSTLHPPPLPDPQQLPQQRQTAAIKLMETDGNFKGSERIAVLRLFTSSIKVVDSYLAIMDQAVRTSFIKDYLRDPS